MFDFLKRLFWGRSISLSEAKYFSQYLAKTQKLSAREQIIECDKLYHKILQTLGYSGNFGDILKRNPKEIPDIQEVWTLHKLRNTLVHELSTSEQNLEKQALKYKKTVEIFLQKITHKN
jgi:hypothetical protein